VFDTQGIVPIGYTLFAFALGAAAGALTRRTVPAMAITVGGFLAARITVQMLRGHLFAPLRAVHALVSPAGSISLGTPLVEPQNWVLQSTITGRSGHPVTDQAVLQTCRAVASPRGLARCITAHGYHQLDIYQPLSRYWPLQAIEFAIFTTLAAVLLAATVWAVIPHRAPRRLATVRGFGFSRSRTETLPALPKPEETPPPRPPGRAESPAPIAALTGRDPRRRAHHR